MLTLFILQCACVVLHSVSSNLSNKIYFFAKRKFVSRKQNSHVEIKDFLRVNFWKTWQNFYVVQTGHRRHVVAKYIGKRGTSLTSPHPCSLRHRSARKWRHRRARVFARDERKKGGARPASGSWARRFLVRLRSGGTTRAHHRRTCTAAAVDKQLRTGRRTTSAPRSPSTQRRACATRCDARDTVVRCLLAAAAARCFYMRRARLVVDCCCACYVAQALKSWRRAFRG